MMNTCGTCKYFGPKVEDFRDYSTDTLETSYHACELIKQRKRYSDQPETELAVVIDGSDYHAVLCVKEEFGCNQWAAATSARTPAP